ncbi:MAG TPA: hypothetical protein VFX51_05480 [Solirubrobacteraceae bacterium]|nr:hypothetical protein [Solirubrobacteraceae bacterium]
MPTTFTVSQPVASTSRRSALRVSSSTPQRSGVVDGVERVVATLAEQRVDAGAAVERVVADAGEDRVAAAEAANHVRTRTGGDGVGRLAAEDVLDAGIDEVPFARRAIVEREVVVDEHADAALGVVDEIGSALAVDVVGAARDRALVEHIGTVPAEDDVAAEPAGEALAVACVAATRSGPGPGASTNRRRPCTGSCNSHRSPGVVLSTIGQQGETA